MNFDGLCQKVAERTGQKPGLVKKVLEDSFDVISETLLVEPTVGAGRFGRFRLQNRGEGMPPRVVVAPNAPVAKTATADDSEETANEESGEASIAFQPPASTTEG